MARGKPLSETMVTILRELAKESKPLPPNDIGLLVFPGYWTNPIRGRGYGGAPRVMGPAQKVIGSLTALRRRGLVAATRRPDGRSGTAYFLTQQGREALDQLAADQQEGEHRG